MGEWGWIGARFGPFERAVVGGPDWLLDVLRFDGVDPGPVELPWHLDGIMEVETSGTWTRATLDDEHLQAALTQFLGGDTTAHPGANYDCIKRHV